MKGKSIFAVCVVFLAFGVSACSDDSSSGESTSSKAACESHDDCDSGSYCHNSKCVKPVKEGKKCLDDVPCAKGLKCVEEVCKKVDDEEEDPQKDPNKPEDTESCETTGCKDGLVCQNKRCVPPEEGEEICGETNGPCPDGTRCVNEVCTAWRQLGEECEPYEESALCDKSASLACSDDLICVPFPKKGESCVGELHAYCEAPNTCVDDVCVLQVKEGEACSELDICESPLACVQGFCRKMAGGGETCDNTTVFCKEGFSCQGGVCLENYGTCETNTDCNADSYCCVMDTCQTKNVCFPYGEGPGGNFDPECKYQLTAGQFEASIQCEWLGNPSDGVAPGSNQIMSTIMVADLPFDSGGASEIVTTTFSPSVIRIFNGENCELLQSIVTQYAGGTSNLALADLDNDGKIEIISVSGSVAAFRWNESNKKYEQYWVSSGNSVGVGWGGPSIHDLDDDGYPEIIVNGYVYDGRTGKSISTTSTDAGNVPCLGDIDNDGNVEMIGNRIYRWNKASNSWATAPYSYNHRGTQYAIADFGTEHSDGSFDFNQKDGIAEIALTVNHKVELVTINNKVIMSATIPGESFDAAGPLNIGDFDGDNLPEIGTASRNSYIVFDPQCTSASVPGCAGQYYLWTSISQDGSSGQTGSSTFDFDSDGRVEVIYGDECYTRIYDGKTGEVHFSSYRTSNTAYENPTIVDVDHDMSAEIIMGSDSIAPACPLVDPNHHGVKCTENSDCFSGKCVSGYCRCSSDNECNWQYDANGVLLDEYSCTTPLPPQSAAEGNVCRAKHPSGIKRPGFRILRDRLDRWASSRPIWNQHAYSVTNVNDDGTVPRTSQWKQNFLDPELNNYRQNAQGKISAGYAPDITGRLDKDTACIMDKDKRITVGGTLCNRGIKDVGSKLPATFYLGDPAENKILCTSYTDSNVVSGECRRVECEISTDVSGVITMVVNDDGKGGRTTVECDPNNNTDKVEIKGCAIN